MNITLHSWGEDVTVDTHYRDREVYKKGAMICTVAPWESQGCPLTLEVAICPDGSILSRGWTWTLGGNAYLHTASAPDEVDVTPQMQEALAGLFSGRILVQGIKIGVGRTPQIICPIDLVAEEKIIGQTIYLA